MVASSRRLSSSLGLLDTGRRAWEAGEEGRDNQVQSTRRGPIAVSKSKLGALSSFRAEGGRFHPAHPHGDSTVVLHLGPVRGRQASPSSADGLHVDGHRRLRRCCGSLCQQVNGLCLARPPCPMRWDIRLANGLPHGRSRTTVAFPARWATPWTGRSCFPSFSFFSPITNASA